MEVKALPITSQKNHTKKQKPKNSKKYGEKRFFILTVSLFII